MMHRLCCLGLALLQQPGAPPSTHFTFDTRWAVASCIRADTRTPTNHKLMRSNPPVTWRGHLLTVNQSQVSPFKSHNPSFHSHHCSDSVQCVFSVTFRTLQMHFTCVGEDLKVKLQIKCRSYRSTTWFCKRNSETHEVDFYNISEVIMQTQKYYFSRTK